MWLYLGRRLLTSALVLFGVSVLTFLMLHFVPGDPVQTLAGRQITSPEKLEQLRQEMGLNDPIPVQYYNYFKNVIQGDFGRSYKSNRLVIDAIAEQIGGTFQLAFCALVASSFLGLLIGALCVYFNGTWLDRLLGGFTIIGISIPSFFLAILLILLFSVTLNWFPATAKSSDPRGLILPVITLAIGESAWLARLVRSSLLDEMGKNYQWTAKAKGLSAQMILVRHTLRNALIPIITSISLQFVYLMGGSVVVESIFARQGIGRLAVTAIQNRDFPLIQGTVLIIALIYVCINTLADLLYAVADPRIRLQ